MRLILLVAVSCFTTVGLGSASARAAEETLQNDSFASGQPVSFQAGFVAGEVGAARFVPQGTCPCVLKGLTLLFGGSASSKLMGIRVWDDAAGATDPGAEIYTGSVNLTGSNTSLQQVDLTNTLILVDGPFRVGLEFEHDGLPSLATDLDGTIDAGANFILADVGGLTFWFAAATLGLSGDFILRATIENQGSPPAVPSAGPRAIFALIVLLLFTGLYVVRRKQADRALPSDL